ADAIIETIDSNPGLVLVTLGPLTNIALALQRNSGIASKVGRCVVMGGAPCCEGNVTPAAEYNIWCDPEAARIVLRSGLPVELVGWHLCRGDAALIAALRKPTSSRQVNTEFHCRTPSPCPLRWTRPSSHSKAKTMWTWKLPANSL